MHDTFAARPITSMPAPSIAVLLVIGLMLPGSARSDESPGERAIKYRKAVYQVILWNISPMSAMAQEKAPYDAEEFALRAERLNAMSYMLEEAYPPESASGAPTRAKPEIWQNRDDFEEKLSTLQQKSAELADISQAGDFGSTKGAFFDMANACKNCHDTYRSE